MPAANAVRVTMLLALLLWFEMPAHGAVRVIVGPTPIVGGDARSARDITVVNEQLAFALAVESPAPYGVPRGAIVDVAPVSHGRVGRDRVAFADFVPDNWSAWPSTRQAVEILERGPDRAVIRSVRDFGRVTIETLYTLQAGSDHVEIRTTMSNGGDTALPGLLSGFTLWPSSGYLLAVPGLAGAADGTSDAALSDRVVAYDEHWTVALHAPYATRMAHGSRDMFRLHSLAPGESRSFEGWLQVGASGDLGPVVRAEIVRRHLAAGRVRGTVSDRDGHAVGEPVVVAEKSGQTYAWTVGAGGTYEFTLPAGEYTLYATARNHSQSARFPMTVRADRTQTHNFRGVDGPGRLRFEVSVAGSGRPLDARIEIGAGPKPAVGFLGRKTFFTELDRIGHADLAIAPGRYVFVVSSGGGFLGPSRNVELRVKSGVVQVARVELARLFDPAARGWYGADLHHHADQAEALTPPADLVRSQLAAGLDLLFVSDHDSLLNHPALREIALHRRIPFIAGVELSPSWGHFNAYPIDPGQSLAVDTSTADIHAILAEARRLGASIVQVNHPFIPYGYFASVAAGVAPGGFDPAFELVEMNADSGDDERVFHRMWEFWNEGRRYYLGAGTDTHDVWNVPSGSVRVYAHVDGTPTAASFAAALAAGHAYVTHGPLVYPSVAFGDRLAVDAGRSFSLAFDLEAVAGLAHAELIGGGAVAASRSFDGRPQHAHVDFSLHEGQARWYALVIEDGEGRKAYSDPIWIETNAPP